MPNRFLTGLVLAAGASRRFGQPKQLLPFRGTTLLGSMVAQAEACPELDEVLVVLGQAGCDVLTHLRVHRAQPVFVAEGNEGCAASYRAGLAAAHPMSAGVAILMGDQPGVDTDIIGRVAAAWRSEDRQESQGSEIVVASYQGVLGHPLVFGRRLFPELAALHGDKAAWKLLDQYADRLRTVAIECPIPPDVDTPDDYAALTRTDHDAAR